MPRCSSGTSVGSLDAELWQRQFDVDRRSPVFLAQSFRGPGARRADPSVVNILDQKVFKLYPLFFS
jgi:NAD(P)-dependent dehydrogenase (short-subunit alcohol dehydrogenase family)